LYDEKLNMRNLQEKSAYLFINYLNT
jgi:hypothetical protein